MRADETLDQGGDQPKIVGVSGKVRDTERAAVAAAHLAEVGVAGATQEVGADRTRRSEAGIILGGRAQAGRGGDRDQHRRDRAVEHDVRVQVKDRLQRPERRIVEDRELARDPAGEIGRRDRARGDACRAGRRQPRRDLGVRSVGEHVHPAAIATRVDQGRHAERQLLHHVLRPERGEVDDRIPPQQPTEQDAVRQEGEARATGFDVERHQFVETEPRRADHQRHVEAETEIGCRHHGPLVLDQPVGRERVLQPGDRAARHREEAFPAIDRRRVREQPSIVGNAEEHVPDLEADPQAVAADQDRSVERRERVRLRQPVDQERVEAFPERAGRGVDLQQRRVAGAIAEADLADLARSRVERQERADMR